ncbi:MAG: hypothetical protein JXA57_16885 [Armatimonadetes bacterium]|nr:hypothetical protein [Armatimonadota bacterium]
MYQSKLSQEFLAKLPALEKGFPAAATFLSDIAENRTEGFWLSTAQNAHLYYLDGYYMYIKPAKLEIEFFQQFNTHIHQDTEDKSHLLFGAPLKGLVAELGGFKDKWIGGIPGGYRLKNAAPPEFFAGLFDLIARVHA